MLSNSVAAACVATAYVIVLFLNLNPALPLDPAHLVSLVKTVGLYYAVHLTAICYVFLVLRQLLAHEVFSPAWISVGVLVWLSAALSTARRRADVEKPRHVFARARRIDGGGARARHVVLALTATGCASCWRGFAAVNPTPGWAWAFLLVLIVGASVAAPLAFRGPGAAAGSRSASDRCAVECRPSSEPPASRSIALDAGIARSDYRRNRRRPVAELRPDPRRRRRAASGDAASDVGRGGLGGGRDREAAAEKRCPLEPGSYELAGGATVQLLPELLLRARPGALRLSR